MRLCFFRGNSSYVIAYACLVIPFIAIFYLFGYFFPFLLARSRLSDSREDAIYFRVRTFSIQRTRQCGSLEQAIILPE